MSLTWQQWAAVDIGGALWAPSALATPHSHTPELLQSCALPPWPLETFEVDSPEVKEGAPQDWYEVFWRKYVTRGARNRTTKCLLSYATAIHCSSVQRHLGLSVTYFETSQKGK